jgi:transcriptional repressor NrdR
MRCPFCGDIESQVKDSRPTEDGAAIRRRRACPTCGARFTTFERIQLREMSVVKADGRTQVFDRDKITRSMQVALRKRPVDNAHIDKAVSGIVRQLENMGEVEIKSDLVGELVMKALARLDSVGFIRYASVYKDFCQPEDFNEFLLELREIRGESEAAE